MASHQPEAHHRLTEAEKETLLAMVSEGLSNAELSQRFCVSEGAIASRLHRLYVRTGLNRTEAIAFGVRHRDCCLSHEADDSDRPTVAEPPQTPAWRPREVVAVPLAVVTLALAVSLAIALVRYGGSPDAELTAAATLGAVSGPIAGIPSHPDNPASGSLRLEVGEHGFPIVLPAGHEAGGLLRLENVSPAQAAALADGVITWEEYETAVWAAFTCMVSAGLEAREEPHLDASGTRLQHSVFVTRQPADSIEAVRNREIILGCTDYHSRFVEFAYGLQRRPSSETLAAAREALAKCLREAGFPETVTSQRPLLRAADHDRAAFGRCSQEVSREYGIPYFAG